MSKVKIKEIEGLYARRVVQGSGGGPINSKKLGVTTAKANNSGGGACVFYLTDNGQSSGNALFADLMSDKLNFQITTRDDTNQALDVPYASIRTSPDNKSVIVNITEGNSGVIPGLVGGSYSGIKGDNETSTVIELTIIETD